MISTEIEAHVCNKFTYKLMILCYESWRRSDTNLEKNPYYAHNMGVGYIILTWETFPDPVKTKVKGPIDFGIIPNEISYPASRIACLAIDELL